MKIDFNNPTLEREHPLSKEGLSFGTQKIWRFKNGYGASVIQLKVGNTFGSYTSNEKEWELAVIKFNSEDIEDFKLVYDTPITNDVIGHLSKKEVVKILEKIKKLK